MHKFKRQLSAATEVQEKESALTAEAILEDFSELVALFERQLATLPARDKNARSHIAKAKAAAERGLLLSRKLLETLDR